MYREDVTRKPQPRNKLFPSDVDVCGLWVEWDEWDEFEPGPMRDDLWDVFELDDETAEPEPQHGDFWGEPDDEEPI